MARFDSALALAQRLIGKNGQPVMLRKPGPMDPSDPSKPWLVSDPTFTEYPFTAVFLNEKEKYTTTDTVRKSTQICYAAALGLAAVPDIDDLIIRDGQPWKVQDAETLNPNGQTVLYKLSLG